MCKDLQKIDGTIAKILTEHKDEIFAPLEINDIEGSKKVCLRLLDDPSIKTRSAAEEAKKFICNAKPNKFFSTLVTYMTGLKV